MYVVNRAQQYFKTHTNERIRTIIDNMKLNKKKRQIFFCDLIFSGSITLPGYMIWDLLIGITW